MAMAMSRWNSGCGKILGFKVGVGFAICSRSGLVLWPN